VVLAAAQCHAVGTMKLLLVEDDFDLIQALSRALSQRGFSVLTCADGQEALNLARREPFDAIVLDLSLPGLDGLQVLQRLRCNDTGTPVLILTARGAVGDRVAGLNAGADDYLPKPFDLDELEARVRALIRRRQGEGDARCGLLRCERDTGAVFCDERPLELSPREAALLRALMQTPGHAVPKDKLFAAVFSAAFNTDPAADHEAPQPDAIEVVVHRLRKRVASAGVEIVTLRGVGYVICEEVPTPARGWARTT
jgi:DNA-binding response OmpR family regulator